VTNKGALTRCRFMEYRGGSQMGEFETASSLEKRKKKQSLVNNNYLKIYRNIFIFIENTRVIAIFYMFYGTLRYIKPINRYIDGNTILVISTLQ
jgi:hypothetical protein